MKTLIQTFGVLVMGAAMSAAWAGDCPSNLNAEQMYNCIVAQGASGDYADDAQSSQAQSDEQPASGGQSTNQQASAESTNHNSM